ncbi:hypothetical protein V498_08700 [Pseudogymnoascus sp. VKM F-4517 (FW-2822)]|nr:hypothetical protein V498_08700 [Pseudogymnoascus sp. VKM F-4517 (FW-2822)]
MCTDGSCTITACIGPGCVNGVCVEPGCRTTGCIGKDCNAVGVCTGPECVGIGCAGDDCDAATGLCSGPECVKKACAGSDCDQGNCEGGNECVPIAGCTGSGCGGTSTIITATGLDGKSTTYIATLGPPSASSGTVTTVTTTRPDGQSTTYIETLVPTTATDSAGHVVTGTITKGPTATSTDDPALITYTTFPPGVSASSTSVTHNTHDSQGNPILGPWPGCWFCPPGSFGWKLFGIGPGVFPRGGPPAGFPNQFPRITIKPNGDPEYESSSSSECKIATVTDVTSWVKVSVDGAITSTATSAYSTDSSITKACSAAAHTTTKYSTTGEKFCEPTSCGNVCAPARKRQLVPSDAPKLDYLPEDRFDTSNITIFERDIPNPGDQGDWGTWYDDLERMSGTVLLDNSKETLNTNTSVEVLVWGNTKQAIVVQGLTGCIALFCVSHIGAFVAHFWEAQSIRTGGTFEADVIYILKCVNKILPAKCGRLTKQPTSSYYLGSILNPIKLGADPACYIMGGTMRVIYENIAADKLTLTRQINENLMKKGYGKGAVLFDPSQTSSSGGSQFPPGYATVAVYLQGYKAIQMYYPNQEFQVWRANVPGKPSTSKLPRSVNLVKQVTRGATIDPCSGLVSVDSSEWVPLGSTITDVGVEGIVGDGGPGMPFSVVDSSGYQFITGCVFRGSPYAPIADPVSGFNAGVISCTDNSVIQCIRPYDNEATTCSAVQAAQCGTLGKDCSTFYQLIATCII